MIQSITFSTGSLPDWSVQNRLEELFMDDCKLDKRLPARLPPNLRTLKLPRTRIVGERAGDDGVSAS